MMAKLAWGRAWRGRSYDLGRMTLPELWVAYATYPAIQIYAALAVAAAIVTLALATRWDLIALTVLVAVAAYPVAWYLIHRFILHGRWRYKMKWTAALWKRIHFDHHQDPQLRHRHDLVHVRDRGGADPHERPGGRHHGFHLLGGHGPGAVLVVRCCHRLIVTY